MFILKELVETVEGGFTKLLMNRGELANCPALIELVEK